MTLSIMTPSTGAGRNSCRSESMQEILGSYYCALV
jgi:hypothetical protein